MPGAKVLRALGVKGPEADLRTASDEFGGHCLALTLLGSYLTDAFDGESVVGTKYPHVLLTMCAREPTPER
jgi:hypothetical protein